MRVYVSVKTRAGTEGIIEQDATHVEIRVKALPIDGQANQAVAKKLAKHFGVSSSCVTLIRGARSREKVFDIIV